MAPVVMLTQLQLPMTTTVDGSMVAARDFGWVICMSVATCLMQLGALALVKPLGVGLWAAWLCFWLRLALYTVSQSVGAGTCD